ncbi:mitochondrial carrier protein [Theileria orientalis strain Shintoku]|uniref:Mitochondrial carrier protein n=1 Tax=Theileria orientalis strain Shintoku TaxID=869250 RepID=J4C964_THEOR|nr:mitochondrial carrier protein [Theileria orientalis strain Shintoku]BAM41993.1 mitochondrial carrier protein [Theileria orientalis strain Shintoku]|eukprot:XP_009692294.1 mitochondrial carrier protein [Theileria orientalis strain Shintoku]
MSNRVKMSSISVVKHIYRTKGLLSFWMGLNWATPLTICGHTMFLYTYDSIKDKVNTPTASLISRLVTLMVCQPFDCMRTYVQSNLYTHKRQSFVEILKNKGLKSMYKGSLSTIVRDVPFSAIHWPINELIFDMIKSNEAYKRFDSKGVGILVLPFWTGAFSSLVATVVSQPFDVIKTNLQAGSVDIQNNKNNIIGSRKSSILSEFIRIKRTYGVRGFFIGVAPRLLKVVPGSAIMSATYHFFN